MVSKGQFMGLDWNRITRLHSQVMTGTHELTNSITLSHHTRHGLHHIQITAYFKLTKLAILISG